MANNTLTSLPRPRRIRAVFKCPEQHKAQFPDSQCLLTISVGQEVHEDEKFRLSVELVNKHFKSCVICVDDSLQRHTMELTNPKLTPEEAYKLSLFEGDNWLKRNKELYEQLSIPYSIIRWDHWLSHEKYTITQEGIKKRLREDVEYEKAFDETINTFLTRVKRRATAPESEGLASVQAYQLCFNYLLEECTALCLWPEADCDFEVYPSKRNLAMSMTHQIFLEPAIGYRLSPAPIKFINKGQLLPQKLLATSL